MAGAAGPGQSRARIWDLPVRLFHWLLVLAFAFAWWSAETRRMDLHRYAGYTMLCLIVFRIGWGCIGGYSARFGRFVVGPARVWDYLRHRLWPRDTQASLGHNPLGGWSVVLMLGLLSVQIASGLFAVDTDGMESGPLSRHVGFSTGRLAATLHEWSFNALLAVIGLHLLAILYYAIRKRHNLVAPMIGGHRRWPMPADAVGLPASRLALRAALLLAAVLLALTAFLRLA